MGCLKVVLGAWEGPRVQPVPPSPRPLSGLSLGPATNPEPVSVTLTSMVGRAKHAVAKLIYG